jgi:hypothetical protein
MTAGTPHVTAITIERDAQSVYDFMTDPQRLSRWSFGTWQTEIGPDGLVLGISLFDGSKTFVRIDGDAARLSIDYHLGPSPDELVPRIVVRVVPGPALGLDPASSVLTFIAWRSGAMTDDRWRRLTACHEMEVVLIKALLERASQPAGGGL